MTACKGIFSNERVRVGIGSFLLALAVIGCSNEKMEFTSKVSEALLSERNDDGKTSDIEGSLIYIASNATVDTSAMDDSDSDDEDAVAETSPAPAPAPAAEVTPPGVEAVLTSEKTDAPAPTASVTPTASPELVYETEKSKGKGAEKAEEKSTAAPKKDEEAPIASSQPQTPAVTAEDAKTCADALGLNPAPSAADFKFELVTKLKKNGKLANANNKLLFSDPASEDTKSLFLKVAFKNVNKSSIELLDPNGLYCVDMKVKNMNKFKFKFHCDAKVVFVNLQSKKSKKSETLRLQCK
jgi:hypothetical protein